MSTAEAEIFRAELKQLARNAVREASGDVFQLAKTVAELAGQVNALLRDRKIPPYQDVLISSLTALIPAWCTTQADEESVHNLVMLAFKIADATERVALARQAALDLSSKHRQKVAPSAQNQHGALREQESTR